MSESYPSWLPMRPPPPAPASTFESSPQPARPRAEDVFAPQGRRPTPRSVRIVARDAPWREPTGESAETRVPPQPPPRPSSRPYPTSSSRPRFKAPNLHLSLLRSPSTSMRLQYLFHYVSTFGHLFLQSYFDLNVVFMLLLVVSRPGPSNNPRNWTLAAVVYIACWAFEIFGVFLLYEVIYSFSRRWRVKRPLILPLYLSTPAHKLVGISSYTNFCFFSYIRRSARPPWSSLFILPSPTTVLSPSPSSSQSSYPSSTNDTFIDYIAEWCFWRSQNLPTIILLLPRAGLSLSLLFNFSHLSGVTGRDSTYFDSNGALSGYARGILFANSAWAVWRALVFLGSILGLWILSGTACAGLCGPRYRWEEERGQDPDSAEKGSAHSQTGLAYPLVSDDHGLGMSDGWSWKQGTRERVREAWEFCLTNTRSGRGYATSNVRARTKEHEDEFAGLDEVLAAAGFSSPRFPAQAQRSVLSSEFFKPVEGREALSDIIPPVHEAPGATDAYGSQRSRKSDPLRVLPYPFKEFPGAKASESGAVGKGKEKEKETIESGSIPFPSPVPSPEDDAVDDDDEGDEGGEEAGEDDDDDVEGEYGEEEQDDEERHRTSESMSSLGRPVNTTYPFAMRRSARSLASASHSTGTPSHHTPYSTSASPSQPHSTPSTRGSRSTPSTRGSRVSRSTYSNMESSDSPQSPRSAASGEEQVLPPPPSHPRRRRRAGTAPAIPLSQLPVPGPSHPGARVRTRTISASGSSSLSRGFDPEPEAMYESDGGPDGRVPSPVADGSQEEAEKEDSVGLLSTAPSPKASLRQRASNLSHHRRGNGSRSVGSASPAGSVGTGSGSGSARSRAQSFIHSLSQRASLGEFGLPQGRSRSRSRSSSAARNESANSDSPRSNGSRSGSGGSGGGGDGKGSGVGSGSNRVSQMSHGGGSGSGSASGTGSGRPSGEAPPGIEFTFGRPGELVGEQERLDAYDAGTSDSPSVYLSAAGGGGGGGEGNGCSLRHTASEISGTATTTPSEATERLQVLPPSEASQSRTDVISTANQSFVTAPLTVESTTTTEGEGDGGGGGGQTLTHGLRQHVPEGTWGHDPV